MATDTTPYHRGGAGPGRREPSALRIGAGGGLRTKPARCTRMGKPTSSSASS